MADSDDEYDRKRRDKFRGERAEATYRGTDRVARPRDEWSERDSWPRPRPREYRTGGVRDRGYSPSLEPAAKRVRHDYYGDNYYNHYGSFHQPPHRESAPSSHIDGQQPPMMSFKAFLATQDDNISDSEAIEKYNDYKLEFQRQQLNEFFVAHKDDEWFRMKYHPEESVKRKDEQTAALKRRVEVFIELLKSGKIDSVSVDGSRTNDLLKLLDTVVIKLEGGTEEDLALLEQEYEEMEKKYQELKAKEVEADKAKEKDIVTKKEELEDKEASIKNDEENKSNGNDKDEEGEITNENDDNVAVEKKNETSEIEKSDKQKDGGDKEEVNEEKLDQEKEDISEKENNTLEEKDKDEKMDTEDEVPKSKEIVDKSKEKEKKRKRSYSGSSSGSSSSSSDSEEENEKKAEEKEAEDARKSPSEKNKNEVEIHTVDDDNVKPEKPKSLHKTTSIFLRNLAPTITRQEIEAICSRYDGFLRVALADPQPERRWMRRGWVTFKRDANIKEICWNLNNVRLRDCELGAIVNRDLSRRIRPINGITAHKQVVRSDIRISARAVLHLDTKAGLWLDEEEDKKEKLQQTFGLVSNNPVLHNITDYLIEEASAEEEELLGLEPTAESQLATSVVERDEVLTAVLDRIILYLRIVHSVDYYNHCDYPNEDEMPNRCGILHARGPPPYSKTEMTQFVGAAVETKMAPFLPDKNKEEKEKNESKLVDLALKDVDTEVDKFVQANTRELAKDKWLCPLSGKKFKGPDFVRKHIFNKHAEKIEEVKKEVEFFNNYLKDPKRPMLAEAPPMKREEAPSSYSHSYGGYSAPGFGRPAPYFNQSFPQRSRGYQPRSRGAPGGGDFRPIIHYRDLDAPREPEEFI